MLVFIDQLMGGTSAFERTSSLTSLVRLQRPSLDHNPAWVFGAFLLLLYLDVWGVSFPSLPGTCLERFFSFPTWYVFGAFLLHPYLALWGVSCASSAGPCSSAPLPPPCTCSRWTLGLQDWVMRSMLVTIKTCCLNWNPRCRWRRYV